MINKEDFSKIQSTILILLTIAAFFYGVSELMGNFSRDVLYGTSYSYLSWVYVLLVPAIILLGFIWFIVIIIKYLKSKSYLSNALRISNIGGLTGLTWFFLIEIAVVILLAIHYDGVCRPLRIWDGPPDAQCSFITYLFSLKDFEATIVLYGSLLWSILVPIVMYITGFLVDWYTSKKTKASQVAQTL